jgi:hypothetical protein
MATNRTTSTGGILAGGGGTKQEFKGSQKVLTSKDLGREAAVKHTDQAFEIVKQQLKATLIDYADRVSPLSARFTLHYSFFVSSF